MAKRALVRRRRTRGKRLPYHFFGHEQCPAVDLVHKCGRNSNIDDMNRASMIDARTQVEAKLRQSERHGRRRANGLPQHGASVCSNTGRDIDGNDGFPGSVNHPDGLAIGAGNSGGEACAK